MHVIDNEADVFGVVKCFAMVVHMDTQLSAYPLSILAAIKNV
jgi:hypothetical protein